MLTYGALASHCSSMLRPLSRALRLPLLLLGCVVVSPGLASCSSADTSDADLAAPLQNDVLPTTADVQAGDPYLPGIDRKPLETANCVQGAKVVRRAGSSGAAAKIVATKQDMSQALAASVDGVQLEGGGKLAGKLALDSSSRERRVTVLFEVHVDYTTSVSEVKSTVRFDPSRLSKCGFGYVTSATHRLAAYALVTLKAEDDSLVLDANASIASKDSQTTAMIKLNEALTRGRFEISIQTVSDSVPGLQPAPLGDLVKFASAPGGAAATSQKLQSTLAWLSSAQRTFETEMRKIVASDAETIGSPYGLRFRFYPIKDGASDEETDAYDALKTELGISTGRLREIRAKSLLQTARLQRWKQYREASTEGRGHLFQLAKPVTSVAELDRRAAELLDSPRYLPTSVEALERAESKCSQAIEGRGKTTAALAASLRTGCPVLSREPWDVNFAQRYEIQPIQFVSAEHKHINEWAPSKSCPIGSRLPRLSDWPRLAVWGSIEPEGIWLDGVWAECLFGPELVDKAGVAHCAGIFQEIDALILCLPN